MNVANLSELVNAQWVVGSTSWELESFAAAELAPKSAGAAFVRDEKELDVAIEAGVLAVVCTSEFAPKAELAGAAAIVVLDVAQALCRLVRLLCTHKNFYEAGALECEIALTQGYSVLSGDIFKDFAELLGSSKMHLCSDAEYLQKISAPLALPPGDFLCLRAGSLFYEDVEFCGRFYANAPICHLFNAPFSRVFAAALASDCARSLKQVFSVVFLDLDANVVKFGCSQHAVIFTHSKLIAQNLETAGIKRALSVQHALKCSVSYSLDLKSEFLQADDKKKAEVNLFEGIL